MISHQYRCIFIEVPKTGSTSIRGVIGQPAKPHLNIRQVRAQLLREGIGEGAAEGFQARFERYRQGVSCFRSYFKFGFVRNPWDRTVSLYNRREGMQLSSKMSFDEFVDWIRNSSDTSIHAVRHKNQRDWFTGRFGRVLVDFIGKFERINDDWEIVRSRLNISTPLPHLNQNPSQQRHYTEYYNARTRDVIAHKFRVDIEAFGYEFRGSDVAPTSPAWVRAA